MALLARVPGRAGFNLTYRDVLQLPISLRDAMLDQMEDWRGQEPKGGAGVDE